MWLRAPERVDDILWEGPLEPATNETVERARREFAQQGIQEAGHELFRTPPLASIGQPEVWSLPELYGPGQVPHHLQAKMEEADFYLVRLSCSFRPRGRGRVRWAGFLARLLPNAAGQRPVAFDLHPQQVYQEAKRQVRVSLSPTLNFQPVEVGMGGAEFGIEYPQLWPIITTAGIGEHEASWDYEEQRGTRLQGARVMHLLVKAPKGMTPGEVALDLEAEVDTFGVLSMHVMRREMAVPLKAQLWG